MTKKYELSWRGENNNFHCKQFKDYINVEKVFNRKVNEKVIKTISAEINYYFVGNDVPDEEVGKDYLIKGFYREVIEILGHDVITEKINFYNEYII